MTPRWFARCRRHAVASTALFTTLATAVAFISPVAPRASAGTRPACNKEVLPAPEAPVTMTRPACASVPASVAVRRSRPRNTAS